MGSGDDDRIRIRPAAPRQRGDAFINKVLRQASKAGVGLGRAKGGPSRRPGSRLGRGYVAARFAGRGLGPNARRVVIKARLVNLARAGPQSTATHLRYIEREGVDRQGGPGKAYGPASDAVDLEAFEKRGTGDRHQFRFIVSPEDAEQIGDLRTHTRHLMARMETDLGTRLEWVAVDHWNTDNPHTHIVLRGKDEVGKDLVIAGDYIARGMRRRASELATQWLGPRTSQEMQQSMLQQVTQERWTGLDRMLEARAEGGVVTPRTLADPQLATHRQALIGRLQHLQRMGLAVQPDQGHWRIQPGARDTLTGMGERGDIIRTMQRAMGNQPRELAEFEPDGPAQSIVGRVAGKGLADELYEKGYLVIDGVDGKAHYVSLPPSSQLEQFPIGAVVEVRSASHLRAADLVVARQSVDGIYRSDVHLASLGASAARDSQEVVAGCIRRLEALRRAGIVERTPDGLWHVPPDLAEQGRQYDQARREAAAVTLRSYLPIGRQVPALGATWLDQQLISGGQGVGMIGFGLEVRDALQQRIRVLAGHGLASIVDKRVRLASNLLQTLRRKELTGVAERITGETGLAYREPEEGTRVSGVYRRSVSLVSGRYAMLDDGMGFSLVPWKPVIKPKLGQVLSATVRGGGVSWDIGRQRGRAL